MTMLQLQLVLQANTRADLAQALLSLHRDLIDSPHTDGRSGQVPDPTINATQRWVITQPAGEPRFDLYHPEFPPGRPRCPGCGADNGLDIRPSREQPGTWYCILCQRCDIPSRA